MRKHCRKFKKRHENISKTVEKHKKKQGVAHLRAASTCQAALWPLLRCNPLPLAELQVLYGELVQDGSRLGSRVGQHQDERLFLRCGDGVLALQPRAAAVLPWEQLFHMPQPTVVLPYPHLVGAVLVRCTAVVDVRVAVAASPLPLQTKGQRVLIPCAGVMEPELEEGPSILHAWQSVQVLPDPPVAPTRQRSGHVRPTARPRPRGFLIVLSLFWVFIRGVLSAFLALFRRLSHPVFPRFHGRFHGQV